MKTTLLKYFFFGIFFISCEMLLAQMSIFKFDKYTVDDGLASNSIRGIIQDSDGFIWIETYEGINKYDGYEFQNYTHISNDSCSISSGAIFGIAEYGDYIWMGSSTGILNRYNKTTGCFKKYTIYNKGELWDHSIWDIVANSDTAIWLASERGIIKFDTKKEKFHVFLPTDYDNTLFNLQHDVIYNLSQDKNNPNNILLGTRGGLLIFDKTTKQISKHPIFNKQIIINDVLQENDSLIWLGLQGGGIVKINIDNNSFKQYIPKGGKGKPVTVNLIRKKSKNEYWVGFFDYGMAIFNKTNNSFTFFKDIPYHDIDFPSKPINAFYKTQDNTFLIGAIDGLYISKSRSRIFRHFFFDSSDKSRPLFFFTNDIINLNDSSYLVTCTQSLPVIIDKYSGKKLKTFSFEDSLKTNKINIEFFVIARYKENKVLVSSNQGIFQLNLKNHTISRPDFKTQYDITKPYTLYSIKDSNNHIFISCHNPYGILRINTANNTAIFLNDYFKKKNIHSIRDMKLINENEILITALPVSLRYNIKKDSFYQIGDNYTTQLLKHEWLNCGIANYDDVLFGYGRKAIRILNTKTGSIKIIDKEIGLSSNSIYEFEKDNNDNIWIATGIGLNVISAQNYSVLAKFDQKDGLIKNDIGILWGSSFKLLSNNNMFIGGHGFFTIFNPDSLLKNPDTISHLLFETVLVNGKEKRLDKVLYKKSKLVLSSRDNTFVIKFANLGFDKSNSENIKFRLKGYDNQWTHSKNNLIYLNKIPPGNYKLELASSLENNINILNISVLPQWWQTWWFKILLLLFNIGLIIFLYRKRITYIKDKERLKSKYDKTLLETEMKMLRSQLNSHFLFNSLNSIKNYIIKNEKRLAVSYLNSFAVLIRKILNNSESKFISLDNELETLKLYLDLEKMRFEDKFDYSIIVDDDIEITNTQVPPLLLQPFVENAIWHGLLHKKEKGLVSIEIKAEKNVIHYIITDNGIGLEKAKIIKSKTVLNKKNYGLKLSWERLNTIKTIYDMEINFTIEDLNITNKRKQGTKVTISFNNKNKTI